MKDIIQQMSERVTKTERLQSGFAGISARFEANISQGD
jgi:hypothetical protein